MTYQEDARVVLELSEHPDRFCPVCFKRVRVCKHTKYNTGYDLEEAEEEANRDE